MFYYFSCPLKWLSTGARSVVATPSCHFRYMGHNTFKNISWLMCWSLNCVSLRLMPVLAERSGSLSGPGSVFPFWSKPLNGVPILLVRTEVLTTALSDSWTLGRLTSWILGHLDVWLLVDLLDLSHFWTFGLLAVYRSPWDSFQPLASWIIRYSSVDRKVWFSFEFTSYRGLAVFGSNHFSYHKNKERYRYDQSLLLLYWVRHFINL